MKRFLRYFLYREVYRVIRKSMRDSGSDSTSNSQPIEPGKAIEEGRHPVGNAQDFPADGGRIESPAQLKAVLQRMDAYDFEHFIGDLWERMGVEDGSLDGRRGQGRRRHRAKGNAVRADAAHPYHVCISLAPKRFLRSQRFFSKGVYLFDERCERFDEVVESYIVQSVLHRRRCSRPANSRSVRSSSACCTSPTVGLSSVNNGFSGESIRVRAVSTIQRRSSLDT